MNLFELFVKIDADTSQAEKGMKSTQGVSETLTNKIKVMSAQFEVAQKNVDKLTQEFNESVNKAGATDKATQELAKKLADAEKEASQFAKKLDEVQKEAEQSEKALDGYNKELGETDQQSEKAEKGVSSFGKKIGEVSAWTVAKGQLMADAIKGIGKALVNFSKQSIQGFAEYEQLAGGAQKIFDQMDYSKIANDANNAYKELGLSANQYLAVINDVGATFAATMGDAAGYEAAKTGLKAISDYASGTGKNVDELSQKFTLITRSTSSYQSIADQFSGILPATSAGFLEQAQAAGILSDSYETLTEVPIDEYQAAVSQMLEKGVADLGLANNTVNEAFSTISGSLSMAKGAWSNLVAGLANGNADIDALVGNFVESVGAVAKNIVPTIGTALGGIGDLINEIFPIALEYIPQLIEEFLPMLVSSAAGIVTSIGSALFNNIDSIIGYGQQLLTSLLDGIKNNAGNISNTVSTILTTFGTFILDNLPEILAAGVSILLSLVTGIADALPELAGAATQAVIDFVTYLISAENINNIITAAGSLISNLGEAIKSVAGTLFGDVGANVVQSIIDGISAAWDGLVSWFNGIWDSLFGGRNVDVGVSGSGYATVDGSHAGGLSYVPYDGYIAELHQGERVLTAAEAASYNNQRPTVNVVQNIYSEARTAADLMQEALYHQERAVLLGV